MRYIGARYVPLMMGEWDNTKSYEPLSVVTYLGNSYTSKKSVPIGVNITDETYWVRTGNYNQQIEQMYIEWGEYKNEMDDYVEEQINEKWGSLSVVTPEMYGAIGDGVTDDSVAIQNAINSDSEIMFTQSYLCSNINIDAPKKIYFTEESQIKLKYYDASKQLFHNVFNITADCEIDGLHIEGNPNDTIVAQTNYTEPIILANGCHVILRNSTIKNLKLVNRANSPSNFSDRRGIVISSINGGDFAIDNCLFDNLNGEEWIQSLGTNYTGNFKITNSRFVNGTGFARITVQGDYVEVSNCEFSNMVYQGSITNLFGNKIVITNNYVHDCDVVDVFDCSESGYFTSKNVSMICNTIKNMRHTVSTGGHCLRVNGGNIIAQMNDITYKGFIRYTTVTTHTQIEANSTIIISNNYVMYEGREVENSEAPISLAGLTNSENKLIANNNTILCTLDNVNVVPPIFVAKFKKIYYKNNISFLSKASGTSARYVDAITFNGSEECYVTNNNFVYIPYTALETLKGETDWAGTRIAGYISTPQPTIKVSAFNVIEVQGSLIDSGGMTENISI